MKMKKCNRAKCTEENPKFGKNRANLDGLQKECNTCRAIMRKESKQKKWERPIVLTMALTYGKKKQVQPSALNDRFKKIQQELKKA